MAQRAQVLALYRQILRISKKWDGPESEKKYIREEAQRLFRRNMNIKNPEIISKKILEAETRIALALHYKIPYPRPYYITKVSYEGYKENPLRYVDPVYMHSYYHHDTNNTQGEHATNSDHDNNQNNTNRKDTSGDGSSPF